MTQTPLTFGSLFAGVGGFDLGFERAGMVCKWQVEIDDYASKVLAKHWPGVHRERDIRECGQHNLERVDVICAGFPCQDLSYAGRGAGLDGARSGLFFEAVRVVRELRPRVVVLENVAALLTRGLDRVLGTLAEIGFDAEWDCVPAAAVGAPHIRDRVFILAYTDGAVSKTRSSDEMGKGTQADAPPCVSRIMANAHIKGLEGSTEAGNKEESGTNRKEFVTRFCGVSGSAWEVEPAVGRVANGVSFGLERFRGLEDVDKSSDTETLSTSGDIDWQVVREVWRHRELAEASPDLFVERLCDFVPSMSCAIGLRKWLKAAKNDKELCGMWSDIYTKPFQETQNVQQRMLERIREAERSQTMGLKRSRVDRLRCLGNAVVPQVAEYIGRNVVRALNDTGSDPTAATV